MAAAQNRQTKHTHTLSEMAMKHQARSASKLLLDMPTMKHMKHMPMPMMKHTQRAPAVSRALSSTSAHTAAPQVHPNDALHLRELVRYEQRRVLEQCVRAACSLCALRDVAHALVRILAFARGHTLRPQKARLRQLRLRLAASARRASSVLCDRTCLRGSLAFSLSERLESCNGASATDTHTLSHTCAYIHLCVRLCSAQ